MEKLSDNQLRQFIIFNDGVPGNTRDALLVQAGNLEMSLDSPAPIADLFILNESINPIDFESKSLYYLVNMDNRELEIYSQKFYLDKNDPKIRDRIIRIFYYMDRILGNKAFCLEALNSMKDIPLSQLICGTLSSSWINLIHNANKHHCSTLGAKIATSIIRIASTRIFSQPEQSILELPVNSIDSYAITEPVGKFGLGFFSFVYWIVGHPSRYIIIESTYREYNNTLCSWKLKINELDGVLVFNFDKNHVLYSATGTTISLHGEDDHLQIDKFEDQLEKLSYSTSVRLYLRREYSNEKLINLKSETPFSPEISIVLSKTIIQNIDHAKGISLNTLFGSLLIPSISTKKIKNMSFIPSSNETTGAYKSKDESKFIVLVGEIAVIILKFLAPKNYNIIIGLKSSVPLPVSRDDILLEREGVYDEFKINLEKVRNQALYDNELFYTLKLGLIAYQNYSPISEKLIDKFWIDTESLLQSQLKFFVPMQYYHIYSILDLITFIPMDTHPSINCETYLLKNYNWNSNIFFGKYVMEVQDLQEKVSTAGTSKFLFVNKGMKIVDITISVPDEHLLPVEMKSTVGEYEKLREKIKRADVSLQEPLLNLITKFLGLKTYYNFSKYEDENSITRHLVSSIRHLSLIDIGLAKDIIAIINLYIDRATIKDYSYSMDKYTLFIGNILNSEHKLNVDINYKSIPDHGKMVNYIYQFYKEYYNLLLEDKGSVTFDVPVHRYVDFMQFITSPLNKEHADFQKEMYYMSKNVYEYVLLMRLEIPEEAEEEKLVNNIIDAQLVLQYWRRYLDNAINRSEVIRINKVELYMSLISNQIKVMLNVHKNHTEMMKTSSKFNKRKINGKQYYLSDIIENIFRNPNFEDVNFLQTEIISYNDKKSLQLLEIAINEGTTREFSRAVLIETFQNAVDAIRNENMEGNIEFNIVDFDDNSIALSISDPVGMTENNILYLSVPFISTKKPSQVTTGEMGSGWFTVYRESKFVQVETIKNGKRVIFIDTPIKRDGRTIDVSRNIEVSDVASGNGTTITVVFKSKDDIYNKISDVIFFIQTVLSISTGITLNGVNVKIEKREILNSNNFTAYSIPETSVSWILTKNVPFVEFRSYILSTGVVPEFLVNETSTGYVLNIKHQAFTPTQTRAKISLSDEQISNLKAFLLDSIYLHLLQKYLVSIGKQSDKYIPNSTSNGSLGQLKFYLSDEQLYNKVSDFVLQYKYKSYKSIGQLINEMIGIIGNNNNPDKYSVSIDNKLIRGAVTKWLKGKNMKMLTTKILSSVPLVDNTNIKVKNFIKVFVNIFWMKGKELNIENVNFDGNAPGVDFIVSSNFGGSYEKKLHKISLNAEDTAEMNTLIGEKFTQDEQGFLTVTRDSVGERWFSISYPATALIHELSHAWRREYHEGLSSHNPIILDNKEFNFDSGANYIYQKILNNNFVNDFLRELDKYNQ